MPGQPLFSLGAMTQGAARQPADPGAAGAARPGRPPASSSMVTHIVVAPRRPRLRDADQADRAVPRRGGGAAARARTGLDGGRRRRPGLATGGAVARAAGDAGVGDGRGRWWRSARSSSPAAVVASPSSMTGRGYRGIEAVVDKDCAAGTARLRSRCRRAVPSSPGSPPPPLDFGTPAERPLGDVPVGEAERHLAAGQFAAGSMGPKVERGRPVRPPRRLDGRDHLRRPAAGHPVARCGAGADRHPDPAGGPAGPRRHEQRGGHRPPPPRRHLRRLRAACWPPPAPCKRSKESTWATAVMATPANLETLEDQGVAGPSSTAPPPTTWCWPFEPATRPRPTGPGRRGLGGARASGLAQEHPGRHQQPRDLAWRLAELPGANIAIVSVPGAYAALEAHKALSAGLDVLLFSDNVPVEEEIELKRRAAEARPPGDGPGGRYGRARRLRPGLRQRVRPGRVGVVAAAGTGAQEVMSLLDQWGEGVSQVIGVGGRDLSSAVGGRDGDVGRPGARRRSGHRGHTAGLEAAGAGRGPTGGFRGGGDTAGRGDGRVAGRHRPGRRGRRHARRWRCGARRTLEVLGQPPPRPDSAWPASVRRAIEHLPPRRTLVRGLYSGGTLCYEALSLLEPALGPV